MTAGSRSRVHLHHKNELLPPVASLALSRFFRGGAPDQLSCKMQIIDPAGKSDGQR